MEEKRKYKSIQFKNSLDSNLSWYTNYHSKIALGKEFRVLDEAYERIRQQIVANCAQYICAVFSSNEKANLADNHWITVKRKHTVLTTSMRKDILYMLHYKHPFKQTQTNIQLRTRSKINLVNNLC